MSIILTQEAVVEGVDVEWISTCAYLVFLGRFGLMFREMGMVRGKNTQAVMFRHLMDMCV
jgi:ammonia channel protein AmtB